MKREPIATFPPCRSPSHLKSPPLPDERSLPRRLSLKDYFDIYKRRQKDLLGYLPKHTGTDYGYTVYTTWQVSLDMIESMRDTASNYALELLKLLCFYHHDQVPVKMLYNAWLNSEEDPIAPASSLWPEAFAQVTSMKSILGLSRGPDPSQN